MGLLILCKQEVFLPTVILQINVQNYVRVSRVVKNVDSLNLSYHPLRRVRTS
jgi:hypothetical protein